MRKWTAVLLSAAFLVLPAATAHAMLINIGLPSGELSLNLTAFLTGQVSGGGKSTQLVVGQVRGSVEGTVKAADAQAGLVTIAEGAIDLGVRPDAGRVVTGGRVVALADVKSGMTIKARGTIASLVLEGTAHAVQRTSFLLDMGGSSTRVLASADAIAAVKEGQRVRVSVAVAAEGSVTAKAITQAAAAVRDRASGTIAAVSDAGLELRGATGDVAVAITSRTTILVEGKVAAASDLTAGLTVRAFGQRSGRTLVASLIVATRAGATLRGTITGVSGAMLTLRTDASAQVRVDISGATVVVDGRIASAAALEAGDQVEVIGNAGASGQFVARIVVAD